MDFRYADVSYFAHTWVFGDLGVGIVLGKICVRIRYRLDIRASGYLILTRRRLLRGEKLGYIYKFEFGSEVV